MRTVCAILILLVFIPASVADASNAGSPSAEQAGWDAIIGFIAQGQARFGNVDISLGASVSQLMCRCMEDESCADWVTVACDPIAAWAPAADRAFFTPLSEGLMDPAAALCYAGRHGVGVEAPPSAPTLARPSPFPADPVLSIEAVRWPDGSRYRYAIRYQFEADDFEDRDYERIEFTVRGSVTRDVVALAGIAHVGSSSDLPLAASFSSDELFQRACITFRTAPTGLPREYCTRIVEVSS
ncbi:MAG: hypothetical protein ACMXYM_04380 [Candidatus Woesearchaeota archaeon]